MHPIDHQTGIVLLHGAGLGSYIWDEVIAHLSYPTLAIDYPHRENNDKANQDLSFDDYLQSAIQQIEHWRRPNIIIVAHSIGGVLGIRLSEYFRDKLKGFIAISAVIPDSGQSFADCLPFPQNWLLPLIMRLFGTKPPDQSLEQELCHDLSAEQTAEIIRRFTPEAKSLYTTKIRYDALPTNAIYIKLTDDRAITPDLQAKMGSRLPSAVIKELASGHLPMMSHPQTIATLIKEYALERP